jgi:hypothetical protein
MIELLVLFLLGLIWLVVASVYDIRKKLVWDWLSFSLLIFVLGLRFFYSLFNFNYDFSFGFFQNLIFGFSFFLWGVFGFLIYLIVGLIFYYSKVFGGGDCKLLFSLGAIICVFDSFQENLFVLGLFILLFLFVGSFYSFVLSIYFAFKNSGKFKSSFRKNLKKYFYLVLLLFIFSLIFIFLGLAFFQIFFFLYGILFLFFAFLFIYSKSVDESMSFFMDVKDLVEGDSLVEKKLKCGRKFVSNSYLGLTKKDISLIKKYHKEIFVKSGVAFIPVFLISYLILFYLIYFSSWNFFGWF